MSEEDNQIENFFRKGLESKEFQFRESDWEKMEAQLDAASPIFSSQTPTTRQWIGIMVMLVLVSFFAGWYIGYDFKSDKKLQLPTVAHDHAKSPSATSPDNNHKSKNHKNEIAHNTVSTDVNKDLLNGAGLVQANEGKTAGFQPTTQPIPSIQPGHDILLDFLPNKGFSMLNIGPLAKREINMTSLLNADNSSAIPIDPERSNTLAANKLSMGIAYSPDFSSTSPLPKLDEIGQMYGLQLFYYMHERWRFSTGFYKSNKNYTASGSEYSPPLAYGWPGGVAPSSTEAVCDVLDIPITAGFRLTGNGKTSVWASGGISSYWLLSEGYRYHYDDYTQKRIKGWWGKNENQHFFSVISLSVSVEKHLNERITIGVEPFIRIPMAGVGYGKVTLYTSGTFLSFRYHLINSKPEKPLNFNE